MRRRARHAHPLADLDGWAMTDTRTRGGLIRFCPDLGHTPVWVDVAELTFLDSPAVPRDGALTTGDAGSPWKAAHVTGSTSPHAMTPHRHDKGV